MLCTTANGLAERRYGSILLKKQIVRLASCRWVVLKRRYWGNFDADATETIVSDLRQELGAADRVVTGRFGAPRS